MRDGSVTASTTSATRADGQIDVEDPAPREMRREIAAEQRTGHARHAEHRAEDALVAAALAWRNDVADDRLRRDHQPTTAESLNGAEDDELRHALAHPAERRAGEEQHDRALHDALAAVQVAELAVERRHDRLREQISRDDPGQMRESAKLADDRRQCGRDDCRIQRGQQHREHEPAEDDQHLLVRSWVLRARWSRPSFDISRGSGRVPAGNAMQPLDHRAR